MKQLIDITILGFVVLCINSEKVSYEGYKLYEVYPSNKYQAERLATYEGNLGFHFLSYVLREGLNHPVTILVSPKTQKKFIDDLIKENIKFNEVIPNFERTIEVEQRRRKREAIAPGGINFDEYHRYDAINEYIKAVAIKYSNVATLLNIGESTEGRDILALKISNGKPKPIILINAGIHAREWIAPAQALYIIKELVENANNNKLIQNVDWIIVPLLNPDGYEYTHTTNRLWRKTRSKGLKNCTGADANRNFGYHWGEKGSSSDECSDTYRGHYAFSEPESRAFRNLVLQYANHIKLLINFHSYSQLIIYPWAYTMELPSNARELQYLGTMVAKSINSFSGASYNVGSVTHTVYYASGDSMDWCRGVAGINLTFTIELPPVRYSSYRFELPSKYIKRVVSETFVGVEVFHSYVENMLT